MAQDFPNNPTLGQVFGSYVWNGTAWAGIGSANNLGVQVGGILAREAYDYHPNVIINGAFDIWQRGTSFGSSASIGYSADRWLVEQAAAATVSRQTFTPGSAPVAGYEGQYFLRYVANTSAAVHGIQQRVEDVRALAGQTATLSFWAKADASRTLTLNFNQYFGTGGSTDVYVETTQAITTSWARYTATVNIPSISSKTIGTNSSLQVRILSTTGGTFTLDVWGVQLEVGTVATPFRRNANSIQGELAACQRYYEKSYDYGTAPGTATAAGLLTFYGTTDGSQNIVTPVQFAVPKRTASYTITTWDGIGTAGRADYSRNGASGYLTTTLYRSNEKMFHVYVGAGGVFSAANMSFHWTCNAEL